MSNSSKSKPNVWSQMISLWSKSSRLTIVEGVYIEGLLVFLILLKRSDFCVWRHFFRLNFTAQKYKCDKNTFFSFSSFCLVQEDSLSNHWMNRVHYTFNWTPTPIILSFFLSLSLYLYIFWTVGGLFHHLICLFFHFQYCLRFWFQLPNVISGHFPIFTKLSMPFCFAF